MQHRQSSTESFAGTTGDLRERLQLLYLERALASTEGLSDNHTYMADLEDEIAATRSSYVGTAVTEIATFRAELSGALQG